MDSYRDTLAADRKKAETAKELRAAIRGLSKRQRNEAKARAATMPLSDRQQLAHAIVAERAFPGVAEAVGQGR